MGQITRKRFGAFWFFVFSLIFLFSGTKAATVNIAVDGSSTNGTVPHFWSECVGCGSMEMCMRKNVQEHFKMGAEELGMKRVRGHGFIEGWMGPSHGKMDIFKWNNGNVTYNFKNLDSVINVIKKVGMQPIIELDFTPPGIRMYPDKSSCPPAKDKMDHWRDLVYNIVKHCIEKYGVEEVRSWYWEVWNEPDNKDFFDVGAGASHKNSWQQFYYTVYDKAVEGALKADPQIMIGGPSTCTNGPVDDFIKHCKDKGTKVSFITNHAYAGGTDKDGFVNPGAVRGDHRGRNEKIKKSGLTMKSVNTEYNTTWAGQGGNQAPSCVSMDNHYNAVFVGKVVKLFLDDHTSNKNQVPDILSYWVISDVFDEGWHIENKWKGKKPFGSVFGLITYQGIRKAAFNSFKLLNMMGNTRVSFTGGVSKAEDAEKDGIDGFATLNKNKDSLCVLILNHYRKIPTTGTDEIDLKIEKLPFAKNHKISVKRYLIDENNSNPYKIWENQKKPNEPSEAQYEELRAAQHLVELDKTEFKYQGEAYTKKFTLSKQGMTMFILKDLDVVSKVVSDKITNPVNAITVRGSKVTFDGPSQNYVRLTLCGLDGKVLAESNFVGKGSVDLGRAILARGFHIVRAESNGQYMVKKVFIQ